MVKKILVFLTLALVLVVFFIVKIYSGLPDDDLIATFYPESTVISFANFDWSEEPVVLVRKFVPLHRISPALRKAVVISEDDTFFKHSGINMTELKLSFAENLKKKRFARGGSTITMQLARNAFLTKNKNLLRKFKEIIITKRIEKIWPKKKILEFYLNIVEWGPNIYGAEAAAQYYFGKSAAEVDLAEGSLLAAILPNPIYYNPFKNMAGARRKQKRVLRLMHIAGLVSTAEMNEILNTRIYLRGQKSHQQHFWYKRASVYDSLTMSPRIPDSLKSGADTSGIIFLPEG
ncbi:MAG: monofunctional biosynthetic peptidoglycan transglycosylase [Calditrichaeota bacterium]|nr:monofunctional biosynthetic peptidoglycan transglycosylase [Calditrichota bacterium]